MRRYNNQALLIRGLCQAAKERALHTRFNNFPIKFHIDTLNVYTVKLELEELSVIFQKVKYTSSSTF